MEIYIDSDTIEHCIFGFRTKVSSVLIVFCPGDGSILILIRFGSLSTRKYQLTFCV